MRLSFDSRILWKREIFAHHDVHITRDDRIVVVTHKYARIPGFEKNRASRVDYLTMMSVGLSLVVYALSQLKSLTAPRIIDLGLVFLIIGAAGIDVWYQYPPDEPSRRATHPSVLPFHELGNVVLSPHRGGAYRQPELERLRIKHLARSINAAARGEPIPHRVDVIAGY